MLSFTARLSESIIFPNNHLKKRLIWISKFYIIERYAGYTKNIEKEKPKI